MDAIDQTLRTLRILWLAFLASLLTFVVVLVFVDGGSEVEPMLPLMLVVVGLTEVPVLFFMRWQALGTLALREPEDLRAEGRVEGDALDASVRRAAVRYQTATIVSFALVESVVLMGFVASFMSGSVAWYGAMATLGLILFLVLRPTRGGILSVLTPQEREGVRQRLIR